MQKNRKLLVVATALFFTFTLTLSYAEQQPNAAGYMVKVSNADKTPRLLYFFSRRNIQCAPHSLIIPAGKTLKQKIVCSTPLQYTQPIVNPRAYTFIVQLRKILDGSRTWSTFFLLDEYRLSRINNCGGLVIQNNMLAEKRRVHCSV